VAPGARHFRSCAVERGTAVPGQSRGHVDLAVRPNREGLAYYLVVEHDRQVAVLKVQCSADLEELSRTTFLLPRQGFGCNSPSGRRMMSGWPHICGARTRWTSRSAASGLRRTGAPACSTVITAQARTNCSSSGAAFWPVPHTSRRHALDVAGVPATLVISTANDPATTYRSGVNLAKDLKGRLLIFEGTSHTVFLQGNACVDKIGTDCLVGGTLPADGTR
jgi:hypothetical protein